MAGAKKYLLVVCLPLIFLAFAALAQEVKIPLSLGEIEHLLKEGVSTKRVVAIVEERGISFDVTAEVRERLRKVGVEGEILVAIERAGAEFLRRQAEAEKKKAEEEKRKLEAERQRLEAERSLVEERKKLEAERQALEEQKKRMGTWRKQGSDEDRVRRDAYQRLQDQFSNLLYEEQRRWGYTSAPLFRGVCGFSCAQSIGGFTLTLTDAFQLRAEKVEVVRYEAGGVVREKETEKAWFADWPLQDLDFSLKEADLFGAGFTYRIIIRLRTGEVYSTHHIGSDRAKQVLEILKNSQELAAPRP